MFFRSSANDATVDEIKQRIDSGESLCLLDVRQPEEFQICRLPGSILMPLSELPARLHELDPEREIIVYCHHGIRSAKAAAFLRQSGFPHARNLRGGIDEWSRRIDPSVPTY